jgi:hypothetical protein
VHIPDAALSAFDVDECRDRAILAWDGMPRELHARLKQLGSYVEFSPSGTGVHVIGTASDPTPLHRIVKLEGAKHVEIYHRAVTGRFMTMTGMPVTSLCSDRLGDLSPLALELLSAAGKDNKSGKKSARGIAGDTGYGAVDGATGAQVSSGSAVRVELTDYERRLWEASLPAELLILIRDGLPEGQRSESFFHAVGWLKDLGFDVDAIEAVLDGHPDGIGTRYIKQGRLRGEIERSYGKVEEKDTREGGDRGGDDEGEQAATGDEATAGEGGGGSRANGPIQARTPRSRRTVPAQSRGTLRKRGVVAAARTRSLTGLGGRTGRRRQIRPRPSLPISSPSIRGRALSARPSRSTYSHLACVISWRDTPR